MRKIITLGIMLLFVGMTISSSTGLYVERQSIKPLSSGNTLYVGGNGTGNYSKIQDAINDSSNGDIVFVYSGTYSETITINTTINLIGENRITTTINGSGSGSVVTINAGHVNLSGFTVRNSGTSSYDAGVEVHSEYNFISNNRMVINSFGIYLSGSNYSIVSGNNCYYNWYGICIGDSDNNNIQNNICTENDAGIAIFDDSNFNNIIDNQVLLNDNGIGLGEGSDNNYITNNSIFLCENGIRTDASSTIISNNIISWCSIDGIRLGTRGSSNIINGNKITNNSNYGIFCQDRCDSNNILNNNLSGNSIGLCIRNNCHDYVITDNNFISNSVLGLKIDINPNPSDNISVYHNNFVNNQVDVHDGCNSTWDDGYPSGGNYLDDYASYDNFSGPNQDIPGSDGIGDTPRHIPGGGGNTDWYPLMLPWGEQRPIANFTYSFVNGGYIFNGSSSYDRDGKIILYEWDFGDGETGQGMITAHGYNVSGIYDVTLSVTDDDGYRGEYTLSIEAVQNQQPSAPLIDGPKEGKAGKSHFYNFTSEEPEGADVSYYVDWGDDIIEPWSDFISSGDTYRTNHGWTRGTYTIRCKSKDIYGAMSDWSELEVTMPKNKPYYFNSDLLSRFLERFPLIFTILKQLLVLFR